MPDLSCDCYILLTKPDHKIRGKHLFLFINGNKLLFLATHCSNHKLERLVECDSIKEAIETAYLNCRMNIHDLHGDYFAYVDFRIAKENIDVNIHPNKKKVHIANEDLIAERIKESVEEYIKDNKNIKQFTTPKIRQSYFKSDSLDLEMDPQKKEEPKKINNSGAIEEEKVYAKSLVRTDPKSQRIDKYFSNSSSLNMDRGKSPNSRVADTSTNSSQNLPKNLKLEASEDLIMHEESPTKAGLKTPVRAEVLEFLLGHQKFLLNELNENQNAGDKFLLRLIVK